MGIWRLNRNLLSAGARKRGAFSHGPACFSLQNANQARVKPRRYGTRRTYPVAPGFSERRTDGHTPLIYVWYGNRLRRCHRFCLVDARVDCRVREGLLSSKRRVSINFLPRSRGRCSLACINRTLAVKLTVRRYGLSTVAGPGRYLFAFLC